MSSPTVRLERLCCYKKLKGCLIISIVVLVTSSVLLLVFENTEGLILAPNNFNHRTKHQLSFERRKRELEKLYQNINSSVDEPVTVKVIFMNGRNTTATNQQNLIAREQRVKTTQKPKPAFIDRIQPSKIPFNRSAFGKKYRLNETRSNLYDFPYIIDGRDVCKTIKEPYLVITVLSVHTHIDTRMAIRTTWGRASNPGVWPKVGELKQKVRLVFLFGTAKSKLGDKIIAEESAMYGDIVQADFVDSYFNLTYKSITGIRWVAEHCPGAKYILKADEDVFVHVFNLISFLLKQKPSSRTVYGHKLYNSDVFREGRWGVTMQAYPLPVYPTYTCGNTYVIPVSLATDMYYTAGLLPYLNIEDVFVTGVLRLFLKAEIFDVIGFTHWFEKKPQPCEFKNSVRISATKVVDYIQYELFEGLKSQKLNDCYKVERVVHTNANRPERRSVIEQHLITDDHIYYNQTSGLYYVL